MMAAPWFKLYSKEILSDQKIKLLEHDHLGKLVILWSFANENDCCIPADPVAIGKLIGVPNRNQMVKHLVWINQFFAPVEGDPTKLVSLRLQKELNAYQEKCQMLREHASKGGLKRAANAKANAQANANQPAKQTLNQTPAEVGSRKLESTPPLPPQGGADKKRRGAKALLEAGDVSLEAVKFGKLMVEGWRKEDPDGRVIHAALTQVITRMHGIAERQPRFTPEVQYQAGIRYLAEQRRAYKAPQYFLSIEPDPQTGKPPFHPYCLEVIQSSGSLHPEVAHAV